MKVQEWSDENVTTIRKILDNYKVEGSLRSEVQMNIKRLQDIGVRFDELIFTLIEFALVRVPGFWIYEEARADERDDVFKRLPIQLVGYFPSSTTYIFLHIQVTRRCASKLFKTSGQNFVSFALV